MTLQRRQELVRLAREFDALIITDDVYDFLQWPDTPHESASAKPDRLESALLPRIVDIDKELDGGTDRPGADGFGNAASNGSFSKICGPGNRTGWVEGTTKLAFGVANTYVEALPSLHPPSAGSPLNSVANPLTYSGATLSGGAPSQLVATFLAQLLEKGEVQKHISDVLLPAHARRHNKMMKAIETYLFPLGVTMEPAQPGRTVVGGYFLWFSLPEGLTGHQLTLRAKEEENVVLANGDLFEVWGDESAASFRREIRVCFTWEDEELLDEGIRRVADVIKRLLATA
ncbi:MAG: hypothetical protein M1830_002768 [Pleopsidium flavum]|nr:MAG: hypothetical protein M1830_002768 [Pleopsidium flavum]